jgi:hydrogenase maturation protease
VKLLVAGIGNIFFGDDGFGVAVADELLTRTEPWPEGVHVAEFGIRSVHLAYELLDGYDALVLVDALPVGEEPGTVVVLEVDPSDVDAETRGALDAHGMSPATVLGLLAGLGGELAVVRVVGCEPAVLEDGIGLSPAIEAAVPLAARAVVDLVTELSPATKILA